MRGRWVWPGVAITARRADTVGVGRYERLERGLSLCTTIPYQPIHVQMGQQTRESTYERPTQVHIFKAPFWMYTSGQLVEMSHIDEGRVGDQLSAGQLLTSGGWGV